MFIKNLAKMTNRLKFCHLGKVFLYFAAQLAFFVGQCGLFLGMGQ